MKNSASKNGKSTLPSAELRIDRVTIQDAEFSIAFSNGDVVHVPFSQIPSLRAATENQRKNFRMIGFGEGIHWPELDEDLSARGLHHNFSGARLTRAIGLDEEPGSSYGDAKAANTNIEQSAVGGADKWEFYQDKKGENRWRRIARNGQYVGASCEGYAKASDAVENAERHGYKNNPKGLGKLDKWEIYKDKKGEYRWRRTTRNGEQVGSSSEGYRNRSSAMSNAKRHGKS